MQTISELNKKIWYRFIKVIFILIITISSGLAVYINFDAVGSYQDDHRITCNYGNKTNFLAYKDKNIYLSLDYYLHGLVGLSDNTKEKIQSICEISQEELTAKLDRIFKGNDNSKRLFDITKEKVITNTYWTAIIWSIISVLIILLIFEIIKRAFYYIVLGKIKPPKI